VHNVGKFGPQVEIVSVTVVVAAATISVSVGVAFVSVPSVAWIGRSHYHHTGIRRAKRNLAEADAYKRLVLGRSWPDPSDLRPRGASIRGLQNSQSVIRIGRVVRFPGSDQNQAAVPWLQSDRTHCQRRLIVNQRLPGD
jgi:hypothetical protein